MDRRRLLLANSHGGSGGDSPKETDYVFDFGNETNSSKLLYMYFADGENAYNDVENGKNIVVRIITIYGTWDFYNFESQRRMVDSYDYDTITQGSRVPQYLEIYYDGEVTVAFE